MINIADNPQVRAQIEQQLASQEQSKPEPAPQYARAPAGDGHEVALKQVRGQR